MDENALTPLARAVVPERFLADLHRLAAFGGVGTGVSRPAFSDADIASRQWLASRFAEAGLEPRVDDVGNLFGLPAGDTAPWLIGSHTDSQPLGGRFDGTYGVLAGLEIARASRDVGGPPIAVVSFQDEEGRFGGLTGSSVWSGARTLDEADRLRDPDGTVFASLRARAMDIAPLGAPLPEHFRAFLEAHIEQGPVLDMAGEQIGIVEAIVGVRSLALVFHGEANHAGTTPMRLRRDALRGAVAFAHALDLRVADLVGPDTVWTIGRLVPEPNAPSIVPGVVRLTLQIRDPSAARLDALTAAASEVAHDVCAAHALEVEASPGFSLDPVPMDPTLVTALETAAARCAPGRHRRMPSGALHDAAHVARRLPTAMLFVPSIGGVSHNPSELTADDDLVRGVSVLAESLSMFGTGHAESL